MNRNQHLYKLVCAALLCAVGIVIPMFMPKLVIGPMSFTPASHVAIFLAMFISPATAIAVCLGTTIGFFFSAPFIIAARAATHIIFATVGAFILKRSPEIMQSAAKTTIFSLLIGLLHGVCEIIVVMPLFFNGSMSKGFYENGFFVSVILLVGLGTVVHSMVDYSISLVVWKPLSRVIHFPVQKTIVE